MATHRTHSWGRIRMIHLGWLKNRDFVTHNNTLKTQRSWHYFSLYARVKVKFFKKEIREGATGPHNNVFSYTSNTLEIYFKSGTGIVGFILFLLTCWIWKISRTKAILKWICICKVVWIQWMIIFQFKNPTIISPNSQLVRICLSHFGHTYRILRGIRLG